MATVPAHWDRCGGHNEAPILPSQVSRTGCHQMDTPSKGLRSRPYKSLLPSKERRAPLSDLVGTPEGHCPFRELNRC